MNSGLTGLAAAAIAVAAALAQTAPAPVLMSYREARAVIDAMDAQLPAPLAGKAALELEAAWPDWVARQNADIRARLVRGDEDSLVNFWLYGTSFTTRPRALARDVAERGGGLGVAGVLDGRTRDLAKGIAAPGTNERLQFARSVIVRAGIAPDRADSAARIGQYLTGVRERVLAEYGRYDRLVDSARGLPDPGAEIAAYATIFKDRGLSSDTSLLPDFAIEQALEAMRSSGALPENSVHRAAIVGPGLDFTNKADGYDFYPQQTIQPFALVDSLRRLGLASARGVEVSTFDLSARVNQHIAAARLRAAGGQPYVITLPLGNGDAWAPQFERYWRVFGDRIGSDVPAAAAPWGGAGVRVRAVRVPADVVKAVTPYDLNVVLERLAPLRDDERFDLVVATNILVYYDVFEQALAAANLAAMLRPGGFLLANNAVFPTPPMEPSAGYLPITYSDRQRDYVVWYRRQRNQDKP